MSYRQFALSEKQERLCELIDQGHSIYECAKIMNTDQSNLSKTFNRLKLRAAKGGYAPDHDWSKPLPPGHDAAGVSSLYKEGQSTPVLQWVKSKTNRDLQLETLIQMIEEGPENYKPFKPTRAPKKNDADLLSLITITDYHVGMLAWPEECGGMGWDQSIAKQVFLNAMHDMIKAAPPAETCLFCQLGDFTHFDGLIAQTPTNLHPLDTDTRFDKLVELAMYLMLEAIKLCLRKFKRVIVVSAEGNHDLAGSVWLRKFVKHMFQDDERVEVIDNPHPFYAYEHGETMLAFHHGHKVRVNNLPELFSSEPRFRPMFGRCTRTYIHTGHLHHEKVIERGGAVSCIHPTLANRDSHAARYGYVSSQGAKVITYHKKDGEIAIHTVRPRM